jgi:hypothetical protein
MWMSSLALDIRGGLPHMASKRTTPKLYTSTFSVSRSVVMYLHENNPTVLSSILQSETDLSAVVEF